MRQKFLQVKMTNIEKIKARGHNERKSIDQESHHHPLRLAAQSLLRPTAIRLQQENTDLQRNVIWMRKKNPEGSVNEDGVPARHHQVAPLQVPLHLAVSRHLKVIQVLRPHFLIQDHRDLLQYHLNHPHQSLQLPQHHVERPEEIENQIRIRPHRVQGHQVHLLDPQVLHPRHRVQMINHVEGSVQIRHLQVRLPHLLVRVQVLESD